MGELSFSVFPVAGRRFLYVQWIDPKTGLQVTRSTKQTRQREAERAAPGIIRVWQTAETEGGNAAWDVFRETFVAEVFPGLAKNSREPYTTVFNAIAAVLQIRRIGDLGERAIGKLVAHWRENRLSDHTIRSYLTQLKIALKWAHENKLSPRVPAITMPPRAKKQRRKKGRAPTDHEFLQMLAELPGEVGPENVPAWDFHMRGLWLSGLRLEESTLVTYDVPGTMQVAIDEEDLSRSRLILPAESHKANREEVLPLTPDFVEHIRRHVPPEKRHGKVFSLRAKSGRTANHLVTISRLITRLGEKAGVIVRVYQHNGAVKFASAHDFRRAFGSRWAPRVRPATLKMMMRHEDIETTMTYYVDDDVAAAASELWEGQAGARGDAFAHAVRAVQAAVAAGIPADRVVREALLPITNTSTNTDYCI